MRKGILVVALLAVATAAKADRLAPGKIFYGSRADMAAEVVGLDGLGTARARIRVTRPSGKDAPPILDYVAANCATRVFVDFWGKVHRFEGPGPAPRVDDGNPPPDWTIRDLETGAIEWGESASGYSVNIDLFRALCPVSVY